MLYGGNKGSRAAVGAADVLDVAQFTKAVRGLRSNNVMPFVQGLYAAVSHPQQNYDLFINTGAGGFLDVGRYTSVDDLRLGKVGDFRGVRILESANIQTFSSTVTVYPMIVVGDESFGWGYFQPLTPEIVSSPDSNNALFLYTSIGAKAGIGSTRFNDGASTYRISRIETSVSS